MTFFTDLLEFQFLQFAVIAILLSSLLSGTIGTFVVVRRSTYIAGAVSHSVLGGIGLARLLQVRFEVQWFDPMLGAALVALLSSILIAWVRSQNHEREDSILSTIWALGMALGITFMSLTPGYSQDLLGYLFGDLLLITSTDLWIVLVATLMIITFVVIKYDQLIAVSFNAQLAELRGLKPLVVEILFTIATALTVVVLIRIAGIVLVIALLTLPAATASRLSKNLFATIWIATVISATTLFIGLWISYETELPTGPTIIELSALVYILTLFLKKKD